MTGWPWPLDFAQNWFEGLWNWVSDACYAAGSWIVDSLGGVLKGLQDYIGGGLKSVGDWVTEKANWIVQQIVTGVEALPGIISQGWASFTTFLSDVGAWITGTIWGWVESGLRWLTDSFKWLQGVVTDTAGWVADQVNMSLNTIGNTLGNAWENFKTDVTTGFGDLTKGLSEALGGLTNLLTPFSNISFLGSLMDTLQRARDQIFGMFDGLMTHSSVVPPGEAYAKAMTFLQYSDLAFNTAASANCLAEALSLGQVDISLDRLIQNPTFQSMIAITQAIRTTMAEVSLLTPLRYFLNSAYYPTIPDLRDAIMMYWRKALTLEDVRQIAEWMGYNTKYQLGYVELARTIPGPSDLIRFVVREVITPDNFFVEMAKQGFSSAWSASYWEAHWRDIAEDRIHQAYHRGVITQADRDKYLVLLDYRPTSRPGISKSDLEIVTGLAKTQIPRVDLRRGWELGQVPDADLVRRFEALGYEDDAPLMAAISKSVALEGERKALITNARSDLIAGYISDEQLDSRLKTLGVPTFVAAFYIADATEDRERQFNKRLVDLYIDSYVKEIGPWTDDYLRQQLSTIIVIPEALEITMAEAQIRKYRKPTVPKPEKLKVAPLETVKRAYREGIITQDAFRSELADRGYAADEIELMVTLEARILEEQVAREAEKLAGAATTTIRLAPLSTLREAFRGGIITEETFRSELADRGYAADEIELIVRVERERMVV